MPKYVDLENHIIEVFKQGSSFSYEGFDYAVVDLDKVGKPRPKGSHGECKTDVYVEATHDGVPAEFKISVKRKNSNEFQHNKTDAKTAEAFFGPSWSKIIQAATLSIKDKFMSYRLSCPEGNYPTKPNSILLGWKLEITNKKRDLSVKPQLTDEEIKNYVYKGTNQPKTKCDAAVNGVVVPESGIAYYLLETEEEEICSAQDVIDQLVPIDKANIGETYLVFTANNYRTDCDKADGSRPLAVAIKWVADNGKIIPYFQFNNPLENEGGRDMKPDLVKALGDIGFHLPCELPADFNEKYVGKARIS